MRLNDICNAVYPACTNIKSKDSFILKLFEAAGKACISKSYARKLFTGEKIFTKYLKKPLRDKDNLVTLFDFFETYIDDEAMVLQNLGILEKDEPCKRALFNALAQQMKLLIDSDEEEVENILISQYNQAKITGISHVGGYLKPLYPGDDVTVFSSRIYEIQSYEAIEHTWELMNSGHIVWQGRKLIYNRGPKDRPEANPNTIEIPVVEPGNSIKITTSIAGRGFDGVTHCIWEMVDSAGENCFPSRSKLFSVTIDAKFKRSKRKK